MSNKISLTLPIDPAYVSAARLTASSVANRMGFDIDEIEDIKAAVSEASTYIIKHSVPSEGTDLQISFDMDGKRMTITILVENSSKIAIDKDDMGLLMIKALIDEFECKICEDENCILLTMVKNHNDFPFEP